MALGAGGWVYHEQPQFCTTCHIMQPYLDSWNAEDTLVVSLEDPMLLAYDHALACIDSHDAAEMEEAHLVADPTVARCRRDRLRANSAWIPHRE